MKKIALIVGIVGAMFLTSMYAIAQTESTNQKLGAPVPLLSGQLDFGATGARDSSANQKLGAPGAAPESDKNIGPGPNDSTIGSDKKPTNRSSAPSKGKKQSSGSHKNKGQSPAQSGGRTSEAPGG